MIAHIVYKKAFANGPDGLVKVIHDVVGASLDNINRPWMLVIKGPNGIDDWTAFLGDAIETFTIIKEPQCTKPTTSGAPDKQENTPVTG